MILPVSSSISYKGYFTLFSSFRETLTLFSKINRGLSLENLMTIDELKIN